MASWLNSSPTVEVQIHPLWAYPEHFETVLLWQHDEWSRTTQSKGHGVMDQAQALQERRVHLQQHLKQTESIPVSFIAIAEASTVVGMVSLTSSKQRDQQNKVAWLSNLFVIPAYRNRDIAAELVAHVEHRACQCRVQTLNLLTHEAEHYFLPRGWCRKRVMSIDTQEVYLLSKSPVRLNNSIE